MLPALKVKNSLKEPIVRISSVVYRVWENTVNEHT